MDSIQALKAVKDIIEFCKTNTISEVLVEEYDSPITGEGVKLKRFTKVEYLVRTIETVVSPDTIDKEVEHLETQISDLTTKKEEIISIGEQIKTV